MTEIPEHLLKRAKEAKERAAASSGDAAPAASSATLVHRRQNKRLLLRRSHNTSLTGPKPLAVLPPELRSKLLSPQQLPQQVVP